jgi:deazaflavin-dependent oxidoreductase (nitroreductase family)
MAEIYSLGAVRRLANVAVRVGVWTGIAPAGFYLLTVRGRKSGRPRSTPVIVLTQGGNRWLVAPYGERAWVKNARAAGQVTLSRRRQQETVPVEEVGAITAAPILKQYLRDTPVTRRFFGVTTECAVGGFHERGSGACCLSARPASVPSSVAGPTRTRHGCRDSVLHKTAAGVL